MAAAEAEIGTGRPAASRAELILIAAIGAATGFGLRLAPEFFDTDDRLYWTVPLAALQTLAAGLVLLWGLRGRTAPIAIAAALAVLAGLLTAWRAAMAGPAPDQFSFLWGFWALLAWPLLIFLLLTLGAAALEQGRPRWLYRDVFRHGLTLPIAVIMGALTGCAAGGFIYGWGVVFGTMGAAPLEQALTSAWTLLPVMGAAAALGATVTLHTPRLLGAGEAALLVGSRILLPLIAVLSALFAATLPFTGIGELGGVVSPTALLLGMALGAMLVFNGVYSDGARPPARPLRWAAWLAVAVLPVYAALALYGISARIDQHGLTPQRVIVLAVAILCAAYTAPLLWGLATEFRRQAADGRWMPPVARLNIGFAMSWAAVLILMQTPLLDPLSLSARDQARRLQTGAVAAADFDFAHLQFRLGEPGRAQLEAMTQWTGREDADEIRAQIARVRAARSYAAARREEPATLLAPETEAMIEGLDAAISDARSAIAPELVEIARRLRAAECALMETPRSAERSEALRILGQRKMRTRMLGFELNRWTDDNEAPPIAALQDALNDPCDS